MNVKQSIANIIEINTVLRQQNLRNFVFFGTLLGFIRENNILTHDKDTDFFLDSPSDHELMLLRKKLVKLGFEIFRDSSEIISVKKSGEYTDLYLFRIKNNKYTCLGFEYPTHLLSIVEDFEIFDNNFCIPNNPKKILTFIYGKKWNIPIIDYHAVPGKKYGRTNNYFFYIIIHLFPSFLYFVRNFKSLFAKRFPKLFILLKKIYLNIFNDK